MELLLREAIVVREFVCFVVDGLNRDGRQLYAKLLSKVHRFVLQLWERRVMSAECSVRGLHFGNLPSGFASTVHPSLRHWTAIFSFVVNSVRFHLKRSNEWALLISEPTRTQARTHTHTHARENQKLEKSEKQNTKGFVERAVRAKRVMATD